jgi:murein DD-endopeptidase MepM/ murein hydrolase activator NlpD
LIAVKVGQQITQGTVIGTVGNTGLSTKPHLHFEVVEHGKKVNPKDFLPSY